VLSLELHKPTNHTVVGEGGRCCDIQVTRFSFPTSTSSSFILRRSRDICSKVLYTLKPSIDRLRRTIMRSLQILDQNDLESAKPRHPQDTT
jgi:hypothetical protein